MTTDIEPMATGLARDSAVPLYAQLEEIFRSQIAGGQWAPGDRIPSENELNRIFNVSRMTVRGVLTRLVEDGLLVRVAGKGTFVAKKKIETSSPAYRGVREQLESLGYQTTTRLIRSTRTTPSPSVQEHLRLADGEDVFTVERVRSADGLPISLHHSFVPYRLAPTLDQHDLTSHQLCVILDEHYNLAMKHVDEKLESVSATTEVARQLKLSRGDPVLLLEDLIFDASGTPYEYSKILFRGDKVQISFSFDL